MDFTLARASILLLYIILGFGITIPPYWYCFNGGKFEEELSSVNLLFIFKNNLLNIVISVLHHDFSFLSQVAFILRGLRRIFDLS